MTHLYSDLQRVEFRDLKAPLFFLASSPGLIIPAAGLFLDSSSSSAGSVFLLVEEEEEVCVWKANAAPVTKMGIKRL